MGNRKNRNSTSKYKFKGNRYTSKNNTNDINKNVKSAPTASERKLQNDSKMSSTVENEDKNEVVQCGVSVDRTWQRKGHLSLNGCVSVISIDTGKVLDIEVLSKMCRLCSKKTEDGISHECEKHAGSSGAMESVEVCRIFERSAQMRKLQYEQFYGDED
ncbi:uncharacterized protein TNCV_4398951 [Trichonephila clavipes]|nr:uncharacterized protein TNCV_4398951 [Trichonephila clavipes]